MTPEKLALLDSNEKNRRVADLSATCDHGYFRLHEHCSCVSRRFRKELDFGKSLDAMAEAERAIPADLWFTYVRKLHDATLGKGEGASASIRRDAILLTI